MNGKIKEGVSTMIMVQQIIQAIEIYYVPLQDVEWVDMLAIVLNFWSIKKPKFSIVRSAVYR